VSGKLSIRVGRLDLRTPLILASGVAGYGDEWRELVDLAAVGAVVLKGISLEPWPGNPAPRLAEAPAGVINAIGLENVGLREFVAEKLPALAGLDCKVVANVVGKNATEYADVCAALDGEGRVDALELNVSCPNVRGGGMSFCADPGGLRVLVRDCRGVTRKPLWVKLAPTAPDVVRAAESALAGGADALTVANTLPALAVDVEARRAVLGNFYGGLSGPAVRPIILRLVHEVYRATGADVIASGGVDGPEAALAYILAGARAVQLGTALFENPGVAAEVAAGLEDYIAGHTFEDIGSLVGKLRRSGA
jgi:dihydroorotate dehydrogenase (NAD+) catalytic subunit